MRSGELADNEATRSMRSTRRLEKCPRKQSSALARSRRVNTSSGRACLLLRQSKNVHRLRELPALNQRIVSELPAGRVTTKRFQRFSKYSLNSRLAWRSLTSKITG